MGAQMFAPGRGSRGCRRINLLQIMCCLIQLPLSLGMLGIKMEISHREHFSSPLRSEEGLDSREMVSRQVRRSMDRARSLTKRSLANMVPGAPSSIEANVTDGHPHQYLMSVSVGTPPQKFMVIPDTGSDLPWLRCAPCKRCLKQSDPVFNASLSSTYEVLPCVSAGCASLILDTTGYPYGVQSCHKGCQYDYNYGGGRHTLGTLSTDALSLISDQGDEFSVSNFWFGCTASQGFQPADGIFGLGQGFSSLSSQLSNPTTGIGLEDRFSYCFVNRSVATVQSSRFVFGHDALLDNMQLQYTPLLNVNDSSHYYVSMEGITVNNIAVNVSAADLAFNSTTGGGTIFDSGTAFLTLIPAAYDPLLLLVDAQIPATFPRVNGSDGGSAFAAFHLCYNVTSIEVINTFPTLSIKFANSSWDLRPENMWESYEIDAGIMLACLAIVNAGAEGQNVIGNFPQQDFHVLYDRVNKRIGFVSTDCAAVGQ